MSSRAAFNIEPRIAPPMTAIDSAAGNTAPAVALEVAEKIAYGMIAHVQKILCIAYNEGDSPVRKDTFKEIQRIAGRIVEQDIPTLGRVLDAANDSALAVSTWHYPEPYVEHASDVHMEVATGAGMRNMPQLPAKDAFTMREVGIWASVIEHNAMIVANSIHMLEAGIARFVRCGKTGAGIVRARIDRMTNGWLIGIAVQLRELVEAARTALRGRNAA